MIRSGDRIPTGTGAARRRLTREEAEAGGLPEPMTAEEWAAMYHASRAMHEEYIREAIGAPYRNRYREFHPSELSK
jgi:hypothetical protein